MDYLYFALIGAAAGILAGFVGVGGGLIIIPALVLVLGYDQLKAQAMSLAVLLPPIGILGFLQYWKNPAVEIDLVKAGIIALCLMVFAHFGAKWANSMDVSIMRKCFSVFMVICGIYMFFKR